jgi:hypothetical protein
LKEEALGRTKRRARFGRDFRPVVRQTTKWMNECQRPFFLSTRLKPSSFIPCQSFVVL